MSDLDYDDHGGGCCGITHVYNFSKPYNKSFRKDFKRIVKEILKNKKQPHLIEVVLNEHQLQSHKLRMFLRNNDFQLVNEFTNGESGNLVKIYHLPLEGV